MNDELPYWTDPEKDEFPVTIEACTKSGKQYEIEVREEVVRAAGGGQAGDKGAIYGGDEVIEFIDTARIDGKLVLVANSPVEAEKSAVIKIDMHWRGAMMRNHTGEHLFVASIKKEHPEVGLGYIWIDGERGIVDLEGEELHFDDLIGAELVVQNVIEKAVPVDTKFVKATEISSQVRTREGLSDKHEVMRIVEVEGYDSSACSGIHVTNTGDIRFFKVIDFKTKDNGIRVTFVAGKKAGRMMESTFNEILRRKHSYPFEMEQIGDVLDKAKSIAEERRLIVDKLIQFLTEGVNSENVNGITFRHEYLPGLDSKDMKAIVKKLCLSGPSVILLFIPSVKSMLTLTTNELPLDASEYIASIVEKMGGRGGGSRDVYTGGFSETIFPEEVYSKIVDHLRSKLRDS
jgi:alanyl-tRNA synthetase